MINQTTLNRAASEVTRRIQTLQCLIPVPMILVIEGKAGSGKTTLADAIHKELGWPVVHADDFFLQAHQRTPERLAERGGNFDRERFTEEVLIPFGQKTPSLIHTMDCSTMTLKEKQTIPAGSSLIIEGTYSMHPSLGTYWNYAVFLDVDEDVQLQRIASRPDHNKVEDFIAKWIPLENYYYNSCAIASMSNIIYKLTD